jgi:tungstate transport system substrate-binding protein
MKRLSFLFSTPVVFSIILVACASATSVPVAAPAEPNLILATTTSTQDSGLLDVLVPLFESQTGYVVQTVAVGTGEALKMGEEGNADVLLVHAPSSEAAFMDAGNGKDRFLVMHNDFIIAGPVADPAGIKGLGTVDAFAAIHKAGALFVTRGDDRALIRRNSAADKTKRQKAERYRNRAGWLR